MTTPPLFSTCPAPVRARATRLYFDVDDTLTFRGRLPADAVRALEDAHRAGLSLVAVTGRSAAWGELLVRLLPLAACIAETGAVCFFPRREGGIGVLHHEEDARVRAENAAVSARLADEIVREISGARLALDNMGRLYDTAYDLVEDGPPIDEATARAIREKLTRAGLTTAQSSVHINAWFGLFDKATMVARYLREVEETALDDVRDALVYVGDSTNDGAMFKAAGLSIGVANVRPHLEALAARGESPRFLVEGEGGRGFAEVVKLLLAPRSA
jgi:HAD superfamily hydrolase (TIGR01484 family)